MSRYKIAFVGQKGIPATYGGVEKHVEILGELLANRGHSIFVYSRRTYNNFHGYYKKMKVINLPAIPQKHTEMISHTLFSCLELLDKNIDIVHIHSVDPAILAFIPRMKTKVVVTSHGQAYRREKWGPIAKSFSCLAEHFYTTIPNARIAVSKTLKKYYEEKYKCDVYYIPNGVNIPDINNLSFEKTFNLGQIDITLKKDSYFLYVGRILPTKGVDILVKAWNNLEKKCNLDKNLVIAGGSSYTDAYVEKLKKQSSPSIIWLGYRYGEELHWLYANAYCCIVPSEIEGLALTLLEAMSYGRCVIYSDIPENSEAAEGVGISFQNKNIDDLSNKILYALENQTYLAELGKKAKERIKIEYNWNDIVIRTEKVYDSILK
ncbi:MAG: glycosyltransferase family 4 protein [candidate division WOR-3 bacterium]|nr:glycosyltransferase family 4 protein [candidate division WOR-3 bacterium]